MFRQVGGARCPGGRRTPGDGRDILAGGELPLLGTFRGAARPVPPVPASVVGAREGFGGGGRDLRVGPVPGRRRGLCGNRPIRRLGACGAHLSGAGNHTRKRRGPGEGLARESVEVLCFPKYGTGTRGAAGDSSKHGRGHSSPASRWAGTTPN